MKLNIIMHYEVNEQTGEITYLGKEEITVETAKAATPKPAKENTPAISNDKPTIVLDSSKLILNEKAVSLLGATAGDQIHIHYRKKDNILVPSIGKSEVMGVKAGNKLAKNSTISFRGQNNEKLAEFGNEFNLEPTDKDGIYYLVGNKELVPPASSIDCVEINDNIEIDDLDLIDDSETFTGLDLTF